MTNSPAESRTPSSPERGGAGFGHASSPVEWHDLGKPPNLLTLARLILTPFVAQAIILGRPRSALILLAIAGVTDGLDGLLARRFQWRTQLGAYLDPIADKLLLSSGYVAMGVAGWVPRWLVGVVFGRDFLIVAVAAMAMLRRGRRHFPPSVWGKLSTLLQILTAVTVIAGRAATLPGTAEPLWWITAAATVWSGMHYGWRSRKLLRRRLTEPGLGSSSD